MIEQCRELQDDEIIREGDLFDTVDSKGCPVNGTIGKTVAEAKKRCGDNFSFYRKTDVPRPGEGYRLLRKGDDPEPTIEGDEIYYPCYKEWRESHNWRVTDGRQAAEIYYRRKIEPSVPSSSNWISVEDTPLPEVGRYLVQDTSGDISIWIDDDGEGEAGWEEEAVAWMPLPAPYVPTTPEKRERWSGWAAFSGSGATVFHTNPEAQGSQEAATDQYPAHCTARQLTEVLPGDVTPEDAIKAREKCQQLIDEYYASDWGRTAEVDALTIILNILKGAQG